MHWNRYFCAKPMPSRNPDFLDSVRSWQNPIYSVTVNDNIRYVVRYAL